MNVMPLSEDHHGPAADRVAVALRRDLLNGDFLPGDRLREGELSARFHCGRYTVRTAIRSLVDSGLLVHERNKGALVPELTQERIDQVFGYRIALELGSLRLALKRGADLDEVSDAVEELAALPEDVEWQELTAAHSRIHEAIVRSSGNTRLISAYSSCQDELQLLFVTVRPQFSVDRFAHLHRRLVVELRKGGETAMNALLEDLENNGRRAVNAALRDAQRQRRGAVLSPR
ncbi:GntR family transcriptional regulator [Streptomyces sp. Inha503]|uniref:GntR family transcriptional regulator n=1 Tax=Streptomyces sp. Inha503 TaxID=3383314 RepID=UPI00399F3DF5